MSTSSPFVLVEMMRPSLCVMAGISVFVVLLIDTHPQEQLPLIDILFLLLCVVIITGAGSVINDYFDVEIDYINRPGRPIPSKRISPTETLLLFLLSSAIGILSGFGVSTMLGILATWNTVVSFCYSYCLKTKPLIGNMTCSYLNTSIFLVLPLLHNELELRNSKYLMPTSFMITLAREIYKDMEDTKGDQVVNAKTLPLVVGTEMAGMVAKAIVVLTMMCSILLLNVKFSWLFLVTLAIAECGMGSILFVESPTTSQKMLKVTMYWLLVMLLVP